MANGDILLNTSYDNTKGSCDMLYDGSVTLCMPVWEVDKGWVDVCETTYYYTMECSGGGGDYNNDNNNDGDGVAPGEFPDTGGGFTPSTLPEPEEEDIALQIDIDQELQKAFPCIANVIQEAYELCSDLNIDFLKYFESSQDFHVVYSSEPFENDASAKTINDLGCSLPCTTKIFFNENYFGTISNLSIAANTIHENTHAMLFYLWKSGEMGQSLLNPTYQELAVAYSNVLASEDPREDGTQNTLANLQHEYKVNFTDKLASTLLTYADSQNINIDMDYARKMIWGGTFSTLSSYSQEFTADERDEIGAIIAAELNNESLTYILLDGTRKTTSPKGEAVTNNSCD